MTCLFMASLKSSAVLIFSRESSSRLEKIPSSLTSSGYGRVEVVIGRRTITLLVSSILSILLSLSPLPTPSELNSSSGLISSIGSGFTLSSCFLFCPSAGGTVVSFFLLDYYLGIGLQPHPLS